MAEYGGAAGNDRIPVSEGGRYHGPIGEEALPAGHALFVRDWTKLLGTTNARTFARRYRAAGFRWISPVLEPGRAIWNAEIAAALAEEGITVFPVWLLPKPDTWRARLPRFVARARAFGAVAPIIDPEAEWLRKSPREARAFVDAMRAEFPLVLFTSYGSAQGVPSFPWHAFLEMTDGAFPQLYDRDLYFEPGYFERGMQAYRARGARRVFVAGSTWAHAGNRMKTPAEIARHLLMLPGGDGARILWAPARLSADRWRVLEQWNRGDLEELAELARGAVARTRSRGGGRTAGGAELLAIGAIALGGAIAVAVATR